MSQASSTVIDTPVPAFESLDEIAEALTRRGGALYGGEAVTRLEHALQCATLAEEAGCTPALITAALWHDMGHLAGDDDDEQTAHSELGARLLVHLFGKSVTEPVRLHVSAKRYLCAVDSMYWCALSEASKQSLVWQGGAYSADQAKRFITQPHADDAVRLRQWDDAAKVPGLATRGLDHFIAIAYRVQVARTTANGVA